MKVSAILAVVGASLIGLWWYLFEYDALPAPGNYSVDWEAARALAGSGGPGSVHTELVAEGEFFGWMLMAGDDLGHSNKSRRNPPFDILV